VKADFTWLKQHLILVAFAALLVFGGVYFVDGLLSKHAAENDAKWQSILKTQQAQTQAISNQLNQDEANWAQVQAKLLAANQQLASAIATRDSAAQKQTQTDATLSASEAAQRLAQQTGAKPGEIAAQGDNISVDLNISRGIVTSLDLLPAAQADLVDTKKQLANETDIATNSQADVAAQKNLVSALRTENTDQQKACVAQVSAVKAAARKSKLKWFGIGYVAGFVSARILGI
jgi:hypothetical protein